MKRVFLFGLPILATFVVMGLGLYLMRARGVEIKPRIDKLQHALGEAVEEFTEDLAEEKKE